MCVFVGYPKVTLGIPSTIKPKSKVFVAENGEFLEKEFLTKG